MNEQEPIALYQDEKACNEADHDNDESKIKDNTVTDALKENKEDSIILTKNGASVDAEKENSEPYDYTEDLKALAEKFPEMRGCSDLASLKSPLRYAALRDLGLSAEEAYLATSGIRQSVHDNRSHLGTAVPRAAVAPQGAMSARELREAREIFGDISDSELLRLYKRVTSNQ